MYDTNQEIEILRLRVQELELRVSRLESRTLEHSNADYVEGTRRLAMYESEKKYTRKGNTRQIAIAEIADVLSRDFPWMRVEGNGNRGKNALRIVDGAVQHPIFLSASRNYSKNPATFSSWHTVRPADISSGKYDAAVFSAENAEGLPLLFVIPTIELQEIVKNMEPSGNSPEDSYYHFYITQMADGHYVDDRNNYFDMTQFHNAFDRLRDR